MTKRATTKNILVDKNRETYDKFKVYKVVEEEEQLRKEEELKIRMGRDQRFKELEDHRKKIIKARKKKEKDCLHVLER